MTGSVARWGVVAAAIVGGVGLWAVLDPPRGAAPSRAETTAMDGAPPLASPDASTPDPVDGRRLARSILERNLRGREAANLRQALRSRDAEVQECVRLLSLHGEPPDVDQIELLAAYTERPDGRFDVAVVAAELDDVTFDRCIDAVLDPLSLTTDTDARVTLDLPRGP